MQLQKAFCQVIVGSAVPIALVVALPIAAEAASFSRLYILGDSLSDTGNSLAITTAFNQANPAIPVIPPPSLGYVDGRFANEKNWIDVLAPKLGLSSPPISLLGTNSPSGVNFAINSATTGTGNTFPIALPGFVGMTSQVTQFLSHNGSADPEALYILWAGANDYLGGGVTDPSGPVTNVSNAVQNLFNAGARNFLVANLPLLGETPLAINRGLTTPLNAVSTGHNLLLNQALNNLQLLPEIDLKLLDVSSLFSAAIANPSQFGLTNINEPCLSNSPLFPPVTAPPAICSNPDEYLFWDSLHPTTKGYTLLANAAFQTLEPDQSVPEPSLTIALLSLGTTLGLSAARKQRKQPQEGDRSPIRV